MLNSSEVLVESTVHLTFVDCPSDQTDSYWVCQKEECPANDIDCILNVTMSVQWQHVSMPSVPSLDHPVVILTVQTMGSSVYPRLSFTIESGNEEGLFDVVRHRDRLDQGGW